MSFARQCARKGERDMLRRLRWRCLSLGLQTPKGFADLQSYKKERREVLRHNRSYTCAHR